MLGQLLSHPKDKHALKFLPPVLNVAKVFFYLLCLSFFVLNNVFLVWSGENVLFEFTPACAIVQALPQPDVSRVISMGFNLFADTVQSVWQHSQSCWSHCFVHLYFHLTMMTKSEP